MTVSKDPDQFLYWVCYPHKLTCPRSAATDQIFELYSIPIRKEVQRWSAGLQKWIWSGQDRFAGLSQAEWPPSRSLIMKSGPSGCPWSIALVHDSDDIMLISPKVREVASTPEALRRHTCFRGLRQALRRGGGLLHLKGPRGQRHTKTLSLKQKTVLNLDLSAATMKEAQLLVGHSWVLCIHMRGDMQRLAASALGAGPHNRAGAVDLEASMVGKEFTGGSYTWWKPAPAVPWYT